MRYFKIAQVLPVHVPLLFLQAVLKCRTNYFRQVSVNSACWFLLQPFRGIKARPLTPFQNQIATVFVKKRPGTRINLQICFSKAGGERKKKNLGFSSSAVISARRTRCIVNSCRTTQREITKQGPGLKPSPTSKCCSRPQSWEHPGLALSCRGVLNPTAFPTQ